MPTVVLTPQYETYSNQALYNYTTIEQYYQKAITTQIKTKTITITTKTTVNNYNPHTIYYSNGQYIQTTSNNNVKY